MAREEIRKKQKGHKFASTRLLPNQVHWQVIFWTRANADFRWGRVYSVAVFYHYFFFWAWLNLIVERVRVIPRSRTIPRRLVLFFTSRSTLPFPRHSDIPDAYFNTPQAWLEPELFACHLSQALTPVFMSPARDIQKGAWTIEIHSIVTWDSPWEQK